MSRRGFSVMVCMAGASLAVNQGLSADERASGAEHPLMPALRHAKSCLVKAQEMKGYECTFSKKEVVGNELISQTMKMKVRHEPFSVYMYFMEPSEGREVIFVDGKNDNKLQVHETGLAALIGTLTLSPEDSRVMAENRYPITKAGLKKMLESIQKSCANIFDKDLEAQCLDKNAKSIILTHHGDMVLRPEYAWSVPQQRPPVCTTFGQPSLVQPVMVSSSLLLGTPLEEAEKTQVGSIMPKFQYTEYISVPGDKMPVCADGSKTCSKPLTATGTAIKEGKMERQIADAKKNAIAEANQEQAGWLSSMEKKRREEEAKSK
jgi:hypothetical protein